ncbi:MAG: 50S ribosomal protein L4 [Chloroflexi bacterium]|nr:50S ribosomal protein L4 [Chloroflexota bacterium]
MDVPVFSTGGEQVGQIQLEDSIFGISPRLPVVHQALVCQLANARQGTVDTKTRGEVSGGGAKPFRQKGTGRARQGSIRSPLHRGGGVVFGPHPRSYDQSIPKKMRRLALKSALSAKVAENRLVVLDQLIVDYPRTKDIVAILKRLSIDSSALIVLSESNANVVKSARNIPRVKTTLAGCLNTVDVLSHDYLIMPVVAVQKIGETFGLPSGEAS